MNHSESPRPGPHARPRLLALDTATERLCVAVVDGERVVTAEEDGGARASARLLPLLQALMAEAGLAMADLDAIAIGRGPGAFTGLRTACSVGQGLALGLDLPVLLLDSLQLVALEALAQARAAAAPESESALEHAPVTLLVAMDARMGETYAAAYTVHGSASAGESRWTTDVEPALWTPAAWQAAVDALVSSCAARPLIACGTAWAALDSLRVPSGVALYPKQHDRAGALARQALRAWREGAGVDAAEALPVYLRDRVALTTEEREAQRQAGLATAGASATGAAR